MRYLDLFECWSLVCCVCIPIVGCCVGRVVLASIPGISLWFGYSVVCVCVDFLSHDVVSVAVGSGVDVIGVCADNSIAIYVDGEPVLSVCVFCDSVFHSVRDEDSAFCFYVCVVCVVLRSLHVSSIPVFGFLE